MTKCREPTRDSTVSIFRLQDHQTQREEKKRQQLLQHRRKQLSLIRVSNANSQISKEGWSQPGATPQGGSPGLRRNTHHLSSFRLAFYPTPCSTKPEIRPGSCCGPCRSVTLIRRQNRETWKAELKISGTQHHMSPGHFVLWGSKILKTVYGSVNRLDQMLVLCVDPSIPLTSFLFRRKFSTLNSVCPKGKSQTCFLILMYHWVTVMWNKHC